MRRLPGVRAEQTACHITFNTEDEHDFSQQCKHALRRQDPLRRRHYHVHHRPPLRSHGPNRRRQINLHEDPLRRDSMRRRAPSSGRRRSASCARISSPSTPIGSSTPSSWATRGCGRLSKSATPSTPRPSSPTTTACGLGELEGIVGEEDGYTAESDAAVLLQGLDIPDELHERKMSELAGRPESARAARAGALRQSAGPAARRAHQLPRSRLDSLAPGFPGQVRRHADYDFARPALPQQRAPPTPPTSTTRRSSPTPAATTTWWWRRRRFARVSNRRTSSAKRRSLS